MKIIILTVAFCAVANRPSSNFFRAVKSMKRFHSPEEIFEIMKG